MHSAPRRGLPEAQAPSAGHPRGRQLFVAFSGWPRRVRSSPPHAHEVFRRAVDIDDFDIPAAVAGEPGPLKCMRRDRDRGAPHLDHPCQEFLDRRRCFAVAQMSHGQRQVRRARIERRRRICSQQIAGRCISLECSCRARCFRNALLCSRAARQSATTTEAAVTLRRSHWSAPVYREMQAGRRERQNAQRSRECNAACIERGRSNLLGQRWHGAARAGTEQEFAVR
jgi:hypothetical protein